MFVKTPLNGILVNPWCLTSELEAVALPKHGHQRFMEEGLWGHESLRFPLAWRYYGGFHKFGTPDNWLVYNLYWKIRKSMDNLGYHMIDLPNIPSYSLQYPMIVSHCMGYIEIVLYMVFFDGDFIDLSSAVISPILAHISVHDSFPLYGIYWDCIIYGFFWWWFHWFVICSYISHSGSYISTWFISPWN